ncbi:unnamed protein product [Adineta steineri]|uniref:Uncharacterized protein n=1 Tax=Adineta steineri TaxID=433720 RepID=A0A814KY27_9BILA|nr:unnamed protein product [Adineta steineri]CAF3667092.1 unnamed protein product [Adineta steineri]
MKILVIIGAGAAGLAAAKVLLQDGFDVAIFEKHSTLSGIWSYEGSYYNLHTQQPGGTMEFSDLYDGEGGGAISSEQAQTTSDQSLK